MRKRQQGRFGWMGAALLLLTSSVAAQAELPTALRDWSDWVRKDAEAFSCPLLVNQSPEDEDAYACAWPGELGITASDEGARFSQRWTLYARGALALPGDAGYWPQAVSADGAPVPVVPDENGEPVVWLEPGEYTIEGRLVWAERPESIRVPQHVALVRLSIDNERVFPLQREGDALWLGRAESASVQADSLSVQVFRLLADGVPALLTTRVDLDVAGEGREEQLGLALPEGWTPVALSGDLPARLDSDGQLIVQVRPGSYSLRVFARAQQPLTEVVRRAVAAPWPEQEIWSYQADTHLRVTEAKSDNPIDPAQAGVPGEWASLPAFLLEGEAKIGIEESSRGLAAQDQNRLNLSRELWLDFDGNAWSSKDRIHGSMVRDWRLDVATPFTLTRAAESGEGLLVTRGARAELSGVEVRNRSVDIAASTRIDAAGELPITGWQQSFDSVQTSVHLPPGYKLYAALGADSADGTWIEQWNLLDVFLVAITTLLAAWLVGKTFGALVLAYLVLAYYEPGAPTFALLTVIGFGLIAKLMPEGKLATVLRWVRNGAFLVLALIALPFVAEQIRLTLYPQLERYSTDVADNYVTSNAVMYDQVQQVAMDAPAAPMPQAMAEQGAGQSESLDKIEVMGARIKRTDAQLGAQMNRQANARLSQRYASSTVVQAGYGEPNWSWSGYRLSWSGPVLAEQTVRLIMTPPWLTRAIRLLVVALLVLVAARLAREAWAVRKVLRAASAAGLVAVALCVPSLVLAQSTPPQEMLDQLRERLLEAPECAPSCAQLASARVEADGDSVRVAMEYHAAARVAVPLPHAGEFLATESLRVNGVAAVAVRALEDGTPWLVLERGVHRIDWTARAASTERIGLSFPLPPRWIVFSGRDWDAGGIRDERLLTDTLELTRVRSADSADTGAGAMTQQFPPFVRVVRHITLGIDWTVDTEVVRIAPEQAAFSVRVPVLPGEHVTSSDFKVEDGMITVPFQAGAYSVTWSSQLDRQAQLALTAPALTGYAEQWHVHVGSMWNVRHAGVPAVHPVDDALWVHEFRPLPEETLTLDIARPEATEGASLAIDGATLVSQIGKRASEHTLSMTVRSTQGGQHVIQIPAEAEVLGVSVGGNTVNVRPEQGRLSLPIRPGAQPVEVRWRENVEIGATVRTPEVNVNAQASNLRAQINLPNDRWVLYVSGPRVGPAVLYWGELLVMGLVAYGLTRLRRTPLKFQHWLLLGLGFSTFSWWTLLILVAWLLALDARARSTATISNAVFNLRQIGLATLTFVALIAAVAGVIYGLLGNPDMHLTGNGSTPQNLNWFHDRSDGAMPMAMAFSAPKWVYQLAMVLWALWLAATLIGWLRWAWDCYAKGGHWRGAPAKPSVKVEDPAALAANKPEEKSS